MNKTKVDDMLIEMITPKVKQIEEKFGNGEGLTQDDINTLLLKSQYNHINHLDLKLDEVTADVASLKGEFNGLKGEFNGLKGEFNLLRGEFDTFKAEMRGEFDTFKAEIRADFNALEGKFDTKFSQLETKFEAAQVKMQETIISTMKWYIGGAGVVLILLKALDLFMK